MLSSTGTVSEQWGATRQSTGMAWLCQVEPSGAESGEERRERQTCWETLMFLWSSTRKVHRSSDTTRLCTTALLLWLCPLYPRLCACVFFCHHHHHHHHRKTCRSPPSKRATGPPGWTSAPWSKMPVGTWTSPCAAAPSTASSPTSARCSGTRRFTTAAKWTRASCCWRWRTCPSRDYPCTTCKPWLGTAEVPSA